MLEGIASTIALIAGLIVGILVRYWIKSQM